MDDDIYFQHEYYDYCTECNEFLEMYHNGLCKECTEALHREMDDLERPDED